MPASNSVFAATLIVAVAEIHFCLPQLQLLYFGQDGVQFSCQCVLVCVCRWVGVLAHLGLSVLCLTVRKDVPWQVFPEHGV